MMLHLDQNVHSDFCDALNLCKKSHSVKRYK
jgi:hypothetical protein